MRDGIWSKTGGGGTGVLGLLAPYYGTVKCSKELFHFNHELSFLGLTKHLQGTEKSIP